MKKDNKKVTAKRDKKKVKVNVKKLVFLVLTLVIIILGLIVIFRNTIFKEKILGETFKLVDLKEYRENVKERKIERIAILSDTTNIDVDSKKDKERILDFIKTIEGTTIKSDVATLTSSGYCVVLYYKDNTSTIINITPTHFSMDGETNYKNVTANYDGVVKLIKELK